jgi:hypothetical protein
VRRRTEPLFWSDKLRDRRSYERERDRNLPCAEHIGYRKRDRICVISLVCAARSERENSIISRGVTIRPAVVVTTIGTNAIDFRKR